tara:strand:+ start:1942 stop:2664 length:723 start_codon:yes stop_codon:yes gene_type:complete
MKYLVVTRADSKVNDITEITHPILKEYAKRCNADFAILTEDSECQVGHGRWHFKIMELGNLLDTYDRILCIDSDTLVKNTCPNLFDVVPYECVGTNLEDKGSRQGERRRRIRAAGEVFGDIGWTENYINTGVFVVSKPHKVIFQKINGQFAEHDVFDGGFDDVHLGYLIHKHGISIHELDYTFNHMGMYSEPWNGSPSRFDSNIIHYAGAGMFDAPSRVEQIRRDRDKLIEMGELDDDIC